VRGARERAFRGAAEAWVTAVRWGPAGWLVCRRRELGATAAARPVPAVRRRRAGRPEGAVRREEAWADLLPEAPKGEVALGLRAVPAMLAREWAELQLTGERAVKGERRGAGLEGGRAGVWEEILKGLAVPLAARVVAADQAPGEAAPEEAAPGEAAPGERAVFASPNASRICHAPVRHKALV